MRRSSGVILEKDPQIIPDDERTSGGLPTRFPTAIGDRTDITAATSLLLKRSLPCHSLACVTPLPYGSRPVSEMRRCSR